ncbi:MAG: septum formation protein Maf [Lentisphaerae bacterium]|nr:septum formation protein Maf [Lentisphaerota bacterium]
MKNYPLILASASPRRQDLLRRCGVDFTVQSVDIEELTGAGDIALVPEINARNKALAVAAANPGCWVLGADTMIIFENRAIGKPADMAEAFALLKSFSGRTHEVITGMALLNKEEDIAEVWSCKSEVKFKKLSDAVIKEYLECVPVLDKAGAYAIQDHGELIVERFSGEMENIIGMPLKKLQLLLKKYSIGGNLVRK